MEIIEILKKNSLRVTNHRLAVLKHISQTTSALSHSDLESNFKGEIDRVSLYRIINAFVKMKLIKKIIDAEGQKNYIFNEKHHQKEDVTVQPHYKCKTCNDVIELPELPEAYLEKIKGLNIDHINVLAEGVCDACKEGDNK